MKVSLASVSFNAAHQPARASIRAGRQRVKVEWRDVCGDWCWFIVSGYDLAAKGTVLSLIGQIERMSAEISLR